jgi:hypothetical protein
MKTSARLHTASTTTAGDQNFAAGEEACSMEPGEQDQEKQQRAVDSKEPRARPEDQSAQAGQALEAPACLPKFSPPLPRVIRNLNRLCNNENKMFAYYPDYPYFNDCEDSAGTRSEAVPEKERRSHVVTESVVTR